MTRKHYVSMAKELARVPNVKDRTRLAFLQADLFQRDNPRFDRTRFYAACGIELA